MAITTLMATFVALHWKFNRFVVYAINASLLAVDLLFLASTSTKLFDGGWFPPSHRRSHLVPDADVAQGGGGHGQGPAGGARALPGVYRTPSLESSAPTAGNRHRARPDDQGCAAGPVAQRQVQSRSAGERAPRRGVDDGGAAGAGRKSGHGRAAGRGHNPRGTALRIHGAARCSRGAGRRHGARQDRQAFDLDRAIYYTGHETIIPSGRRPKLARWREALFAFMHHNAQRPGAYFKIPGKQIMEIGVEFEI